jgi:colanic acid biosynthesis glycosyl transferase WcaI
LKVLIVSQYFSPESFRVNDVATGLVERGHEVTVLTGQPNYETGSFFEGYSAFRPRCETIDSVTVQRFPLVSRGTATGARLAANYLSFALSSSLLSPLRLRQRFDAIVVYQMSPVTMAAPAFILKRLHDIPIVFWIQDLWPETLSATGKVRSERVLKWMRNVVGAMYRASDLVLVESEAFRSAVVGAGIPPTRVEYLPEWAEGFYKPCELEPNPPEAKEMRSGFRVMFAGNIGVAQATDTIIGAASLLRSYPDIQWIFIGDGRRKQFAEALVKELALEDVVSFLGRRPPRAMPRYFALADVLLVTLVSDPVFAMTIPAKLQTYLACGRPIAAALDGEGARVVVDSGSGLVCPAESPEALADVVLSLYHTPSEKRAAMGHAGRAYYEANFEREMLLSRLERLIEGVAGAGPSGP